MTSDTLNTKASPIAIIGMGCVFPESRNLKEYWRLLFNGGDAIKGIPEDSHWRLKDYFNEDPAFPDHTYCTRGGFLPDMAFDPLSYGIPPNNIDATDTSQLLGLEVARMALEDAGYPPGHEVLTNQKVNVVLGVTGTQELVIPLGARLGHPFWKQALEAEGLDEAVRKNVLERIQSSYVQWQENSFPGLLGNVVAGRIANRLNLSGTNCVSDAACASSLSAIHTAVMELQSGRCDMSITGGVDTLNDIFMHMCFSKTGVLSHTSDAKPFSKDADGTVLGEGIGMLVLKRLEDAQKDQDRIYAVIRGMGTASDGKTSAIYAPEAKGQVRALTDAYARAGIDPATVDLVEAHGTGTRVGDKVEFTALRQCYEAAGSTPAARQATAIGSVKSMIGHTKAAAGAAGIIKTALALYNRVIPPTLKAGEPDPELEIETSPFYLNDRSKPWVPRTDSPRRSGISAFGFGGSNFHAVLEEYQGNPALAAWDGSVQIFAFSAEDQDSLGGMIRDAAAAIAEFNTPDQAKLHQAVAWQARESRTAFRPDHAFRILALWTPDQPVSELLDQALETALGNTTAKAPVFMGEGAAPGKLSFIFPGQGSQYPDMAREIMSLFPEGSEALTLAQAQKRLADGKDGDTLPLSAAIYPLPAYAEDKKIAEERLRQTHTAQPAIGAVSKAMTDLMERFGIMPAMTCGHSFGELSALYAAGWLEGEDFLHLAAARGRFMADAGSQSQDAGSMMAVQAPLSKIRQFIEEEKLDLVLANENSPSQGVLSGSTDQIESALKACKARKMRAVRLPVSAAFHSPLVEEAARPFSRLTAKTPFTPTGVPVLSNTTGSEYPKTQSGIQALIGDQLMHPVRFIDNIQAMFDNGASTFVEVGPKPVLTGLVKTILKGKDITALALDHPGAKTSGLYQLAEVLCTLGALGHGIDLTAWETPADKPKPSKMTVILNGANTKPTPADIPPAPKQAADSTETNRPDKVMATNQSAAAPGQAPKELSSTIRTKGQTMTPYPDTALPRYQDPTPPAQPAAAPAGPAPDLSLVQKGLEAMQQLQAQTARAHEKFLETQAQASRTLADLMARTRGEISYTAPAGYTPQVTAPVPPAPQAVPPQPVAVPPQPVVRPAAVPVSPLPETRAVPKASAAVQPAAAPVSPVAAPALTDVPPATPGVATAAAVIKEAAPKNGKDVQGVLFDIVSRLTGFPQEMLEPEMDIESDLGIDSIKKVEIISELEKELPDGAGLSSDHLTTVRTLDDICSALGGTATAPAPANQPAVSAPKAATPSAEAPKTQPKGKTMSVLVGIISELTGFPNEMLEPEMNLESDLGIDSIKRVEILSRLEQELPDIRAISPDEMGTLKTLDDIVTYLTADSSDAGTEAGKKKTSPAAGADELETPPAAAPLLLRQEISLKTYPTNQIRFYNGARIDIDPARKVYLTADNAGIADSLRQAFENQGCSAALVDLSGDAVPALPDAAGLVIIPDAFGPNDDRKATAFLTRAFELARKNGPVLMDAAAEGSAFFSTVSFLGGAFGFRDPAGNHICGGLAGLSKTADIEWKTVLCRALDLPADLQDAKANADAAAALMMTHGSVEMGLNGDTCFIPELKETSVPEGRLELTESDVVVITGGAKGVTAECALALAKACSPKIALLGRSPQPFEEPEWLIPLDEAGQIKKGILAHEFQGKKAKPAEIEQRFQAIMSNRAIKATMDRIRAHAADLAYYPVDIRDQKAVKGVFQTIREQMGPVTAVIHGAGVLKDKLILEKTRDQFQMVMDTKVGGLKNLMAATENDPLSHVVLFSSVAARFGNQGQCDYAMANEVLNKFAQAGTAAHPDRKYLSINWGPWDGGMVNDGLRKEFSRRGIDLIPLQAGAEQMIREMAGHRPDTVEVVIGASLKASPGKKETNFTTATAAILGPKASPVINHHRIDRQPVVPLAMMADLLAHAGEKNNPGLKFGGLDQMHLLKGILPKGEEKKVEVRLGKCIPEDGAFSVPARLTSDDDAVAHASGSVRLVDTLPAPPALSKAAFMELKPSELTVARAYQELLFHGPALQCITGINGVSSKGIEVTAQCRPDPGQWYADPHSRTWTLDPLMLDAAFQAAILWTWETRRAVCLPNYMANLRIYASYPEHQGDVRILFTVNHDARHSIQGYFTFLDSKNTVIASIMGFEALTDKGLRDKFKPAPLFSRDKILAFAEGNPSEAFGSAYKVFDREREIARLPRPPYFFMDRVISADHTPWKMAPGGWIEAEYDIPRDEWYFRANRSRTMPFCILLEIALQPCGWLAAFAGSALQSDDRLHFRNLGGKATLIRNIDAKAGTLLVRSRMKEVSKAGGMIIQDFDMEVLNKGEMVYQGTTNFGFFTSQALANQIGIRNSRFHVQIPKDELSKPAGFDMDAPVTPDDPSDSPDTGMPAAALRMIDAIDYLDFEAGLYGQGMVRAHKRVNPEEWFFDAHFFQDPVCPGSLGVESFLQLLRYFMVKKYQISPADYKIQMAEQASHEWVYRGQIIPKNKEIEIQAHISDSRMDDQGCRVTASGSLLVDGICIYEMKDFCVEFGLCGKGQKSTAAALDQTEAE